MKNLFLAEQFFIGDNGSYELLRYYSAAQSGAQGVPLQEGIMDDIKFEIVKHVGILSTNKNNWKKELNVVSWNGRNPKLDVRDWSPEHEKMGKGITLTPEEGSALAALLIKVNKSAP